MPIRTIKFKIRVVVEKDESAGYFAHCPDLQGVAVEGSDLDDLKHHVECAIQSYLESLLKHDDPIPVGLLELDETHDVLPYILKKCSEKLGFSKSSEYIQEILFNTDDHQNHNHAAV